MMLNFPTAFSTKPLASGILTQNTVKNSDRRPAVRRGRNNHQALRRSGYQASGAMRFAYCILHRPHKLLDLLTILSRGDSIFLRDYRLPRRRNTQGLARRIFSPAAEPDSGSGTAQTAYVEQRATDRRFAHPAEQSPGSLEGHPRRAVEHTHQRPMARVL